MNIRKLTLLFIAALSAAVFSDGGIAFEQGEHIHLKDACISVGRLAKIVFSDDFTDANWRICRNKNDNLAFFHGERSGRRGLIIAKNPGAASDTAFELRSRVLPVVPGIDFSIEILATGNWEIQSASEAVLKDEKYQVEDDESHGFFGDYSLPAKYRDDGDVSRSPLACRMALRWLDKRGAELSALPLNARRLPETLVCLTANGTVPKKAAYAQIILGAETPDFGEDSFLMFINAAFSSKEGRLYPNASFVSRPFPIPNEGSRIEWKASTPGRTSVSIQLSTTENLETGEWTPFAGPGMDSRRAYVQSGEVIDALPPGHNWMRYKVYLHSDGKNNPVLKSIKIGKLVHEGWSQQDDTPPAIEMLTALRMEDASSTIAFKINDDTGVEWRTLEMQIDGVDVSASLKREENVLSYTPNTPLKCREDSFDRLESWIFKDRNALLHKYPLTGGGCRIVRDGGEANTFFQLSSPKVPVLPFERYVFSLDVRGNMEVAENGDAHVFMTFFDNAGNIIEQGGLGRIFLSEKWRELQFGALAPLKASDVAVTLKWEEPDIFDGRFIELRDLSLAGKRGQLNADGVNMHVISIQASDLAGNVCRRNIPILYSRILPGGLTLDDNGAISRSGAGFLPIGLANVWLNDKAEGNELFELRKNGFNSVLPLDGMSQSDLSKLLVKLHANGIAAFISLNGRSISDILNSVAMAQDKAAAIFWVADSAWLEQFTAEEVEEIFTAIRGIAPDQPLAVTCSVKDEKLFKYVKLADVFMPAMDTDDDVCEAMGAARKMSKNIIPIFRIGKADPRLFDKACAAMLCGGKGLVMDCRTPEAREMAFAASEKILKISNVLYAQDDPAGTNFSFKGCRKAPIVLSRNTEGYHYVICYNADSNNAKLSFVVEDCDFARRMLENTSIKVGGTRFSDTLEAGHARIYRLERLFE